MTDMGPDEAYWLSICSDLGLVNHCFQLLDEAGDFDTS